MTALERYEQACENVEDCKYTLLTPLLPDRRAEVKKVLAHWKEVRAQAFADMQGELDIEVSP
jgi:hypothetical protein